LQRHHRRGRLAACGLLVIREPDFCIELRVFGNDNQVIDCVQAKAHRIEVVFRTNLKR
jgi:hypothetical protein